MEYGLISVLPPLLTIGLALITRNVYLSLFTGVISSYIIIDGNIITALNNTLNGFANTFTSTSNVIVMGCILTLGALTYMFDKTGGIDGFVNLVLKQKGLVKSPKGASIFTFIVGCITSFSDSSLILPIPQRVQAFINFISKETSHKVSFLVGAVEQT